MRLYVNGVLDPTLSPYLSLSPSLSLSFLRNLGTPLCLGGGNHTLKTRQRLGLTPCPNSHCADWAYALADALVL